MKKIVSFCLIIMFFGIMFGLTHMGTPTLLETTWLPTLTYVSTYTGIGSPLIFAEVKRVVDGDTIVVLLDDKPRYIRMVGIDTPETVHPNKPVQPGGKTASDFTKLLTGKTVGLTYDYKAGTEDFFGRYLCYVYVNVNDTWYNWNLMVVLNGYGIAYTKYPFSFKELYKEAEKFAQENRLHLWY